MKIEILVVVETNKLWLTDQPALASLPSKDSAGQ